AMSEKPDTPEPQERRPVLAHDARGADGSIQASEPGGTAPEGVSAADGSAMQAARRPTVRQRVAGVHFALQEDGREQPDSATRTLVRSGFAESTANAAKRN